MADSIAGSIIVIQPGSSHLLVGRATDQTPTLVPHAIAYRRRNGAPVRGAPTLSAAASAELAGATRAVLSELPRVGLSRAAAPPAAPAPRAANEVGAEWGEAEAPFLCGEAALRLPPDAPYELFFPLRRGRFNYSGSAGAGANGAPSRAHSAQEVSDSLARLWAHAILEVLEISAEELPSMGVLLLVRDSYERREVREMLDVLSAIGFGALALHLRSSCACLGAGLQSGCVVEIDSDTVEVAVVDDGVPLSKARYCLPFGRRDVEHYLSWLLEAERGGVLSPASLCLEGFLPTPPAPAAPTTFADEAPPASEPVAEGDEPAAPTPPRPRPPSPSPAEGPPAAPAEDAWAAGVSSLGAESSTLSRKLDVSAMADAGALTYLAAQRCQLQPRTAEQVEAAAFELRTGPLPVLSGQLSALATHAPLLLLLDGRLRGPLLAAERAAVLALEATQLPARESALPAELLPAAKRACLASCLTVEHSDYLEEAIAVEIAADTRSHHAKPKHDAAGPPAAAPGRRPFDERALAALGEAADLSSMEIAEAVVRAISANTRAELRPKLYANILLAGSFAHAPGLAPRVREAVLHALQPGGAESGAPAVVVEALLSHKASPQLLAWRGATLLAASESMHELWIQKGEWLNGGPRVLRERLPFFWSRKLVVGEGVTESRR
ncbi:hypothetical protein T492DRAFT_906335 [Pavlovales sp. CCMP2436]|nr:hypothetical protein T492DRAFT_906335 [Pavlovales sp. CCMP2436]